MTLETSRLRVRPLGPGDAAFIVELLNDPSFIENVGDKEVRTLADARLYLEKGPMASYAEHGFGLCAVDLLASNRPAGICGLLKRPELDAPDLGFAFLPHACGHGYAGEAARAVLDDAARRLQIPRVLAITVDRNARSIALLERLGFTLERYAALPHEQDPLRLYAKTL